MHIIIVIGFFAKNRYEQLTGMPHYCLKISKALQKRGHNVEIITAARGNRRWVYEGVPVYDVQCLFEIEGNSLSISQAIIDREIRMQRKLREIDKENKIDIVQYAGWSGVGFGHSISAPSVLRLSTYSKKQYDYISHVGVISFWERMAGRRVAAVISPSKIMADFFSRDIKKPVTIIETPYVPENEEDDNVLKSLGEKKYILFAGSASVDKGFETIMKMLPELLSEEQDLYFVFAGWDKMYKGKTAVETLKNNLGKKSDRFIYLGVISHNQLIPIIRKSKLLLIPSIKDNLPNICIEAMFLDKIVIGTYGSSLDQMIKDGENGFLIAPGDADALLAATKRALSLSDEEYSIMVEKGKILRKPFSESFAVEKLLDFYKILCADCKKRR